MNKPVPTSGLNDAMPSGPQIALFVEDGSGDWHARRLRKAMEARGARVVTTTLSACAFDTSCPCGMDIPGFDGLLPDGAFVRSVSTGTLEQITFRLGILHALRESGVRVWNEARAIERCVDKSTATFLFQKAGLPTPPTRVVETRARAEAHLAADARPFVLKPLFGSQGNGVRRAQGPDELPPPEAVGDVYYMQHYLRAPDATLFEDWRVFVCAGRVLSAMVRRGKTWITNVHQGAEPVAHDPCADMSRLALAAVTTIGADYAGVDLIRDADGRLMVLEINSNPAWKGLQSVTAADIADILAADFLQAVTKAPIP
ncbi:ATP-grasp domain-containing protein [Hyphomicrobium sp.]|uniref:ATP-grasp domain-containing protein n=1 Tax=Hyphomicrobium sp. TaxID=82 RepID=UPI0025BD9684|nr:ATP-grasp domain-containing protein [Hyphomicrobium sp.]MCC7250343.1 ATP-grasp domain-containing protein [Hyphomicrobium sp.]